MRKYFDTFLTLVLDADIAIAALCLVLKGYFPSSLRYSLKADVKFMKEEEVIRFDLQNFFFYIKASNKN